jgi:hypothetical protein
MSIYLHIPIKTSCSYLELECKACAATIASKLRCWIVRVGLTSFLTDRAVLIATDAPVKKSVRISS